MKSLIFLTSRKLKNKLFELMKSPGKLIMTLGFILLFVMNMSIDKFSASGSRPIVEFYAIIFVFYIICFMIETKKGFERGGTMFSLCDVNFLFLSPIKPAAVLFYAMAGRMGASLWMGIAFIYQFSLLRTNYAISFYDMIYAVIGYGAVAFLSQLAGMLIYFFTCGNSEKLKKAKLVFYLCCAVFLVPFALSVFTNPHFPSLTVTDAAEGITAEAMKLFPVVGWVFAAVEGIIMGLTPQLICAASVSLFFAVAVFVIISSFRHGYYEDVLLSAEKTADSKGTGEVRIDEKTLLEENRKIRKGKGASAFFHKHLLENRRTKATIFPAMSAFYLVIVAVYAFVFKRGAIELFMVSSTFSVLSILTGRWVKELTLPYIYLVPDKPVKKLFYLLPEMLPKVITESVLHCLVIGFVGKYGAVTVVAMIFARISLCFVLMASALIVARFFREKEKNNIFVAVCIFVGMVFAIPSIISFFFFSDYGMGVVAGFGAMTALNIPTGFLLLFFARNLLKFSD